MTGCRPGRTRPPTMPNGWRRPPRPAAAPPRRSARPRPSARPAGPRASAAGPPGRPQELRGVQGPGPDRGQAPRGRRPRRRGRPPARPASTRTAAGSPARPKPSASSPAASPTAAAAADRHAAALADAAQRSGIADDGFGPVDAGDELIATARARVAARRDDIGEIRRLLEAIRDAKAKRAYAEQELSRKQAAHERQQHEADAAAARLAAARAEAADDLAAWSARWSPPLRPPRQPTSQHPLDASRPPTADLPAHLVTAADAAALAAALDRTGEPGAASLAEVVRPAAPPTGRPPPSPPAPPGRRAPRGRGA